MAADSFNSIYESLAAVVRRHPGKTAIVYEDAEIDYCALLGRIDNAARQLRQRGIGQGMTFAAYCWNCPDLMYAYYAAAKLGAVFVPMNPNLTPAEVAFAVSHSGAKLLLHDDAVTDAARAAVPEETLVPISMLAEPVASDEDTPAIVRRTDDFLIIYTSGSTGTPKAIVLDHAALVDVAQTLAVMWGVTERDVTLVGLPLGYLYGLSTAAGAGLQSGCRVVILRRFHPRNVLETLVAHQATIYHGVPTMYSMMLEYCEQNHLHYDLSFVRELICAGAPLSEEMRRRFSERFRVELHNYYAATEATPVFCKLWNDPAPVPEGSAGKAAPGLTVRIVRSDGTECRPGEQGEILVRATATMKRYLNDEELTRGALKDGLFRTGDLGYRDAAGWYFITGRIKDVIIRGGANISPAEVEKVLCSHPGVQDAAVIGVPDRIFGEVPVAFVVRRHGSEVNADELERHIASALSDFKVPRRYMFEDALPQGKTGKVDKTLLRKRCVAEADAGSG